MRSIGFRAGPSQENEGTSMTEQSDHDPTRRLSFKEKLGYGLGDTASNFFFQVTKYVRCMLQKLRQTGSSLSKPVLAFII